MSVTLSPTIVIVLPLRNCMTLFTGSLLTGSGFGFSTVVRHPRHFSLPTMVLPGCSLSGTFTFRLSSRPSRFRYSVTVLGIVRFLAFTAILSPHALLFIPLLVVGWLRADVAFVRVFLLIVHYCLHLVPSSIYHNQKPE